MNSVEFGASRVNLFPLKKFLEQFGVHLSPTEIDRQTELKLVAVEKTVDRMFDAVMRELRTLNGDLSVYEEPGYIEGVKEEILFWWQFVTKNPGKKYDVDEFNFGHFFNHPQTIDALDIGAAVYCEIGTASDKHTVNVTCVDPLAVAYNKVLDLCDVQRSHRIVTGEGETLLDQFGPQSFDLVYVKNALDHARDPHKAFLDIMGLLRPSGVAQIIHFRNEGENQGYNGMHQWNIDYEADGRTMVFWNKTERKTIVADKKLFKLDVEVRQIKKNATLPTLFDQITLVITRL